MSDRTVWADRLGAIGLSERTVNLYGSRLDRLEQVLAEMGADLTACSAEQFEAAAASLPDTSSTRRDLRKALRHATAVIGRADLPVDDLFPPLPSLPSRSARPVSVEAAEVLERTAWGVGGPEGLAVIVALHTALMPAEIAALRWEQFVKAAHGTVLLGHGASALLHPRLVRALEAHAIPSGYVFPGRPGQPVPAKTVRAWCRAVAGLAGLGNIAVGRLQVTRAGEVDPDAVAPATLRPVTSWELTGPAPVTVEDLLATGRAPRTARTYHWMLRRVAVLLAERGVDLLTCAGADLAAVAGCFANSNSTRGQLRGALRWGWEVLGREHPPALRAVRMPPKPRARSRALADGSAEALEQAAWERDDLAGLAVLIGLYGGLRRAEIAGLRWEDFTDDGGTPIWMRVTGKGDLTADVPVHPVLAEALTRFRRDRGWLFPGRDPRRGVNPTTIWSWTKLVCREAGLAEVPTHVLRHTALTQANDHSGDLRTVQEIARHSRPEITAVYTRVTGQRMRDVVATIDYGRTAGNPAAPDPADHLPGLAHGQLLETLAGSPAAAAAWIELGTALHMTGGWTFAILPDGSLMWAWGEHPDFSAGVSGGRGGPEFDLYRLLDDDLAECWTLAEAAQVPILAAAVACGAPAPPARQLGPWVEEPFLVWLDGGEWPGVVALT